MKIFPDWERDPSISLDFSEVRKFLIVCPSRCDYDDEELHSIIDLNNLTEKTGICLAAY